MDRTLLSRTAAFVVVALLSVTTLSCSDSSPPVSPELNLPGPARQIVDAAHSGGNAHFFWLPPMVAQPSGFNGAFDPSLSPVVRVCDLSDCDSQVVAEFTTASGTGSEAVQLESDHYVVDWHVDDSGVVPGPTYRIRVLAGGTQLGLADVQFGENGKEARNLTTNEVIGLNEGRTLPIKFRIEEGAVFVVSPADGGTVEALEGTVNLAIPPGALTEETGVTVESAEPTGEALVAVDFGPDGLTFEEPVPVTIGYDPLMLPPGLAESDLALNLLDGLGRWIVLPGSVVDPATHTVTAPFYHFSTGGVGAASLAVFCPDDGDPATFDDLTAAVDAVRRGGTVEVCEGTHTVQGELVDRPITIQGAAGSRPTFIHGRSGRPRRGASVGHADAPESPVRDRLELRLRQPARVRPRGRIRRRDEDVL